MQISMQQEISKTFDRKKKKKKTLTGYSRYLNHSASEYYGLSYISSIELSSKQQEYIERTQKHI